MLVLIVAVELLLLLLLLDELGLILVLLQLLLLLSLMLLKPEMECPSMDSEPDKRRVGFGLVKPLSELMERRRGRIWPLKKSSSAAHICVSAKKELPRMEEAKSNSSSASMSLALSGLVPVASF